MLPADPVLVLGWLPGEALGWWKYPSFMPLTIKMAVAQNAFFSVITALYINAEHDKFLDAWGIVQKRIPCWTPEYNGSCECGVKKFKNIYSRNLETQN